VNDHIAAPSASAGSFSPLSSCLDRRRSTTRDAHSNLRAARLAKKLILAVRAAPVAVDVEREVLVRGIRRSLPEGLEEIWVELGHRWNRVITGRHAVADDTVGLAESATGLAERTTLGHGEVYARAMQCFRHADDMRRLVAFAGSVPFQNDLGSPSVRSGYADVTVRTQIDRRPLTWNYRQVELW